MRIESGHPMTKDVAEVAGDSVRFVADDGRTMFEVRAGKDGKSLEVRGVDNAKVNGVLYATALCVIPNVTNSITVAAIPYDAV